MQNGGGAGNVGVSVAAPNPQPYIAPLQGLNPNVFKYEVNTKPLDTSPLIQVMQTKDSLALQREKIAVEREENQLKKEMQEKQLEFQEIKFMHEVRSDLFNASGGKETYDKNGNLLYTMDDLRQTPKFAPQTAAVQQKIAELENKFAEISKLPIGTKNKLSQIYQVSNEIKKAQMSMPSNAEMKMDVNQFNSVWKAAADPTSDIGFSIFELQRISDNREALLNAVPGAEQNYKLGSFRPVAYDKKAADKALTTLLTDARKMSFITDVATKGMGSGNIMILKDKKGVFSSAEVAAEEAAINILSNREVAAHASNIYGIDLLSNDSKAVELLKTKLETEFKVEDTRLEREAQVSREFEQLLQGDKKSTVEYTGGTKSTKEITESRNTLATITGQHTYEGLNGTKFVNMKGASTEDINRVANSIVDLSAPVSFSEKPTETQLRIFDGRALIAKKFLEAGGDITDPKQKSVLEKYMLEVNPEKQLEAGNIDDMLSTLEPLFKTNNSDAVRVKTSLNDAMRNLGMAVDELQTGSKLKPAAELAKKKTQQQGKPTSGIDWTN